MPVRSSPLFAAALATALSACAASDLFPGVDVGPEGEPADAGGTGDDAGCPFGQVVCEGALARVCDGHGGYSAQTPCASEGKVCAPSLGCVACIPFTGSCADGEAEACDARGTRRVRFACDPVQGMTCEPDGCHGACSPAQLAPSSIGCEFWPTVTANDVLAAPFAFGVMVASASDAVAHLVVTRGDAIVARAEVAPGHAATIALPWVADLKGPEFDPETQTIPTYRESVLSPSGAYRLRSDGPVSVWQHSPLATEAPVSAACPDASGSGRCYASTNGASLLLPTHALGTTYVVTGYRAWHPPSSAAMGDFVAITATADGTDLTVEAEGPVLGGGGFAALAAGEVGQATLAAGDVLELFSDGRAAGASLSGTHLHANAGHPLSVLSGVGCVDVPDDLPSCDHVEESVLPLGALGSDYLVAAPTTPLGVRSQTVRVHGVHPGTTLTFDPAEVHPSVTLGAGDVVEIGDVATDFRVSSAVPFAVTLYLHGAGAAGGTDPRAAGVGDPSESLCPPTAQFRSRYAFAAPTSFADTFVNVVAPTGASVTVDGTTLASSELQPLGATGWSVARRRLAATSDGAHEAHADKPFGLGLYGYAPFTSYYVPAGLDLAQEP